MSTCVSTEVGFRTHCALHPIEPETHWEVLSLRMGGRSMAVKQDEQLLNGYSLDTFRSSNMAMDSNGPLLSDFP